VFKDLDCLSGKNQVNEMEITWTSSLSLVHFLFLSGTNLPGCLEDLMKFKFKVLNLIQQKRMCVLSVKWVQTKTVAVNIF